MRVLFFLEPVIFRDSPSLISAHFHWVEYFSQACRKNNWNLALTANESTCTQWTMLHPGATDVATYPVNPFTTLAAFGHSRKRYAKAAYAEEVAANPLTSRLEEIRAQFSPTLVVTSSQNSFVRQVFFGIPMLNIEQAPLPRLGHPIRTAFDPCGHQISSLLETYREQIRTASLSSTMREQAMDLLESIKQAAVTADPSSSMAIAELEDIRRAGPVALLVMQPTDAVTFEGAYESMELENVLHAWAEALPPGWIGVPTFHAGQRLTVDMEQALAAATSRLRFLSREWSQGFTEPLLTVADGMVTISSTCAMAGLLFQKHVVVVGRAPYNAWCPSDPAQLDASPVLTDSEVASLLCFLTHRLAISHELLDRDITPLADLMRAVIEFDDPGSWFTELSGWTLEQASKLFHFRTCIGSPKHMPGCLRTELQQQLSHALIQSSVYESEWKAAVADRDRINLILSSTLAERDALSNQMNVLDEEKNKITHDLMTKNSTTESRLILAISKQAELLSEISATSNKNNEIRAELLAAQQTNHALRNELAIKLEEITSLQSEATIAQGNLRDLLSIAQNENHHQASTLFILKKQHETLIKERDQLQLEHDESINTQNQLRQRLEAEAARAEIERQAFLEEKTFLEQEISKAETARAILGKQHGEEQLLRKSLQKTHDELCSRFEGLQLTQAALTIEHKELATQLANANEELNRIQDDLTISLDRIQTYRETIACIPRWRLLIHYKAIMRDDTFFDLLCHPKKPSSQSKN